MPYKKIGYFQRVFLRRFRLKYRVYMANAEGESEIGYFVGRQHMTSFFVKFLGWASAPLPPGGRPCVLAGYG